MDSQQKLATPQSTSSLIPAAVRDHRLLTLFEIAAILATEHALESMLSKFIVCLVDNLENAERGALLLFRANSHGAGRQADDGLLHVWAAHGYSSDSVRKIQLVPGEGICGKTFAAGESQLFPSADSIAAARQNLSEQTQAFLRAATPEDVWPQSSISIPLRTDKAIIGVLVLENLHRPESFLESDSAFLNAVAGLIALSIENALLKSELQATEALREANRLKTELISTLAHEMRTPLTSIKGYSTALLMEDAVFGVETQKEFLQIIDEECDALQDLIHDLLESSIIDAGLLKLEPQPVRLPRLAQEAIHSLERRSSIHRVLVDFPDDFPIIDADPLRVSQVLHNLLDNAVKYSPQGGLIVVRGVVEQDRVVVSVADQGVGLAPEHINRLFEVGFRVKSGLIRHVSGSGLGLPICLTIVEQHNGQIWAESELGRGTTLFFSLPIVARPGQEA